MKKMKASTFALILVGAATLALGAAFALTAPKDSWSNFMAMRDARMKAWAQATPDSAGDALEQNGAAGPGAFRWQRGNRAPMGHGPGMARFGGRGHGGPGGLLFLALLGGIAAGIVSASKGGKPAQSKEGE